MIEPFRSDFNARFTEAKYAALVERLERETGTEIEFRIAETPCFFPQALLEEMVEIGRELTEQLLGDPDYLRWSRAAVPPRYDVPGQGAHPHFMTVDFGLVRNAAGALEPKLVELQAFPSIFGFQPAFGRAYKEVFDLDPALQYTFSGLSDEAYWEQLRAVVVGDSDPAGVVLLEVDPWNQKTSPDFRMHEKHLGLRTVDITTVEKEGRRLFYRDPKQGGRRSPIERIYNRAIVDELVRREIALPFDHRDEMDVVWAGHPNWYFQISKFSLPFLHHRAVPPAVFLDAWFRGEGRDRLPEDRTEWILKPLYSFAGKGITFAPSEEHLGSVAHSERNQYLLQQRVSFEPVIETPKGKTQAEIRILYVWPEGGRMTALTNLIRMGRGQMMGVDHNRDQTWVGGSCGLFPATSA